MPEIQPHSLSLATPDPKMLQQIPQYHRVAELMDANWNETLTRLPTWLPEHYAPYYRQVVSLRLAVTISVVYLALAAWGNDTNRRRGYQRWSWSQSRPFRLLMHLHNAFQTGFSLFIFSKSAQLVLQGFPDARDEAFYSHMADYLCRVQAPLLVTNKNQHGLWSGFEGVAALFFLSKYYDLVDSMILFATGRSLSRLHIFHHGGVIICSCLLWRLASPHAVIGVVFNSGVHTLMYLFFLLRGLKFNVSVTAKRWLTTVQIGQFIIGWLLGCCYLFIRYDVAGAESEKITTAACLVHESHLLIPVVGGAVFLFPLTYLFLCFYQSSYGK